MSDGREASVRGGVVDARRAGGEANSEDTVSDGREASVRGGVVDARRAGGEANSGDTVSVPAAWRSVLRHLGYNLPADLTAEATGDGKVSVNLPLQLARQSIMSREYWEIPEEVAAQYRRYRPTPLWRAHEFERAIGARVPIYVKYEGGNIAGSHKLNTALAQAYYYRNAGVRELVTGTGAGQWGTALAAACALFGLDCTVFMVDGSLRKKPYRGTLMRLLGADVQASPSRLTAVGRRGLSAGDANSLALAIGEAAEYAGEAVGRAFAIGSGETYSILHQSVIGLEAEEQLVGVAGGQPDDVDAVVGSLGAGSNFGGIALPFFARAAAENTEPPLLLAVESSTTPKLTRGVYAYDHTDASESGPMEAMYTIGNRFAIPDSHSAGLRFHAAAKLLSAMRHHGQITATAVGQAQALAAGRQFTLAEAVLPAPESGHALAAAALLATGGLGHLGLERGARRGVLVCLSGHGYLDLGAYEQHLAGELRDEAAAEELILTATAGLRPVHAETVPSR